MAVRLAQGLMVIPGAPHRCALRLLLPVVEVVAVEPMLVVLELFTQDRAQLIPAAKAVAAVAKFWAVVAVRQDTPVQAEKVVEALTAAVMPPLRVRVAVAVAAMALTGAITAFSPVTAEELELTDKEQTVQLAGALVAGVLGYLMEVAALAAVELTAAVAARHITAALTAGPA